MEFNATFIVAFISFIIFTVVMNLILYKPIDKIVSERQKFIDDNYDVAKLNSDKSKAILEEKEEKISNAKNDARADFSAKLDAAKAHKEEKLKEVKQQTLEEINQKRNEVEASKNNATNALKSDVVNLAQAISDKFLSQKEEIDNNLIEEVIKG